MHFEISSAICFNLDQSEILSSGNELTDNKTLISFYTVHKKKRVESRSVDLALI